MTASQFLNASYSLFSYAVRRFTGILLEPPLPPAISVEVSSVCNLACRECMTGAGRTLRRSDFIDYSLAASVAGELSGTALSAWLYFQGEPMLHPRFFDIASLFRRMNAVISTNGHFLDRDSCARLAASGLKQVIISYDGVSPAAYNAYREGGDHSRVTEGIKNLHEALKGKHNVPSVRIQFLVGKHNESETMAVSRFAKAVNASFRIKSMQVINVSEADQWIPVEGGKSRYRKKEGKYMVLRTARRGCFRMWRGAVITSDGDVVPCCYDKNGRHVMGNLRESSFREIWRGTNYREFRAEVMKSRSHVDICRECVQGRRLFFRK